MGHFPYYRWGKIKFWILLKWQWTWSNSNSSKLVKHLDWEGKNNFNDHSFFHLTQDHWVTTHRPDDIHSFQQVDDILILTIPNCTNLHLTRGRRGSYSMIKGNNNNEMWYVNCTHEVDPIENFSCLQQTVIILLLLTWLFSRNLKFI